MKRWLKAELHAHTGEDPADGQKIAHTAWQLIEAAAGQGFEVLAITNHDQMLFTPSLEYFARQRGVVLIPGVEATLRGKHVLLYNFPSYQPCWRDFEVVARNKGSGQLVVAPHPFFPSPAALGRSLREWCFLFDGIEYSHCYFSWLNFNRRAERFAARFRLPLIGTSDAHHLFQLGPTHSLIHAEAEPASIITALKGGDVRLVTRPMGPSFAARWAVMAAGWTALRLTQRYRPGVPIPRRGPAALAGAVAGADGASRHS